MAQSIHDYDGRLRSVVRRIRAAPIGQKNRSLILKFEEECVVNGLSKGRVVKYLYYMLRLAKWMRRDFAAANLGDIRRVVGKIETSTYVPFSKMELKMVLRKFYKWLRGTEGYPPEVKWISLRARGVERTRLPEEMLTQDDVKRLIDAAKTARDRAFVAFLYESGCRIGEALFVRIKHLRFDQYGLVAMVDGKTGPRRIRLVLCASYIAQWLNEHPMKDDPEAPLWVTYRNEAPSYNAARDILVELARRAGVKKKVNPHLFRHSRATHLANHLTEAQMKEYFGWVHASDMAAVYVHLSGRDVDQAILKANGIAVPDAPAQETLLRPRACPRCNTENPATHKFCALCGMVLDAAGAAELIRNETARRSADQVLDTLLKDETFKATFISKMREALGAQGPTPA